MKGYGAKGKGPLLLQLTRVSDHFAQLLGAIKCKWSPGKAEL
jgi:hypothetical protein